MAYTEKRFDLGSPWVTGSVYGQGAEVRIRVEAYRDKRNGETETVVTNFSLRPEDVNCVIRTLQGLRKEAVVQMRERADSLEAGW
jgi:hypothetical protein